MKLFQLVPAFLILSGIAVAQSPAAFTSNEPTPAPPAMARSFDLTAIDKTAVLLAGGVFIPPFPGNDDPAVPTEFINLWHWR